MPMGLFDSMNRKSKRQFDKELTQEQKDAIVQAEVLNKITPAMNERVAKAVVDGTLLAYNLIYMNYIEPLEHPINEFERERIISDMMRDIKAKSDKFVQNTKNVSKDETASENEESEN
jgi:hypothetical protein